MPNRIRELREARALTQAGLAQLAATTPQQIGRLEEGKRRLTVEWLIRLARALGCSPADLIGAETALTAPLVGYVGAGEMYYADPRVGPWGTIERVVAPAGANSIVAVRIEGDALSPVYRHADLLFFRRHGAPLEACVGRDCIVQVRAGPAYLKTLVRSDRAGRFVLRSHRSAQLSDVEIEWAAPVHWVKRA